MSYEKQIVEAVQMVAHQLGHVCRAIFPDDSLGHDETGGTVCSLTESVMGVTRGLVRIAAAIDNLADAVREHGSRDVG